MRISEQRLREYINPPVNTEELSSQLTMAGLEVAAVNPAANPFTNVVVGEVKSVAKHPDADRLHVCEVDVGTSTVQIVCGARNVRAGLKVPVAMIGAKLSEDFVIRKTKLRGVESSGMICSLSELGLEEKSAGIMELSPTAEIGMDFRDYYQLNDNIFEIELTPNRGDCLSVLGIAREVGLINKIDLNKLNVSGDIENTTETFPITISEPAGCPYYAGRIIRNVNSTVQTPLWMAERLRRSGIKQISAIVDITNYVMLEIGQPLHAFDLAKLDTKISVRLAKPEEKITLLDGQEVTLDEETLLIADESGPLAMAGVMGGLQSSVTDETIDLFLESAFFAPEKLLGVARKYGLHTESSHRFERGVDYALQNKALDLATKYIVQICGGTPGELCASVAQEYLPKATTISLRRARIQNILGVNIADNEIEDILKRLGVTINSTADGWEAVPPSFRFDLQLEIDLIEEIARIYGYENITEQMYQAPLVIKATSEQKLDLDAIKALLVAKGYNESITYSFVDQKTQELLNPGQKALQLINPISTDMSVMRVSMWPGLIKTMLYNLHRQQERIKLFEAGTCFVTEQDKLQQVEKLGGIVFGAAFPEQWGVKTRSVDFFDVKNDLELMFALTGDMANIKFVAEECPGLHPAKSAAIYRAGQLVGKCGALHPLIKNELNIKVDVYLFEINLCNVYNRLLPKVEEVSRYPAMRRDIAFIVAKDVTVFALKQAIVENADKIMHDIEVFDIYTDSDIGINKKSVALKLVFQDKEKTLVDEEVDNSVTKVIDVLKNKFAVTMRGV
jgi:phenylalanyl-tRNA synthetase beta chain